MDSDGDDNISLNSTEDEAEDGKAYYVDDILAEKQDPDGKTFWLVSWEGYTSDYHMWLPEENFDDSDTLQEWKVKKQKIQEGTEKPYDWKAWDRNQALLKQQKHAKKESRKEKREIKRARLGAVEHKGHWTLPKYRRRICDGRKYRSSDDDTYSEDEGMDSEDDQDSEHDEETEHDSKGKSRPSESLKRKIVTISDSEDDMPLVSLRRTKSVPERVEVLAPSGISTLALPFRSSQSPFPPENRPSVGLQKPMEKPGPSAPPVSNTTANTTDVSHPLPSKPVQPVARTSSDVGQTSARLNATSSTFPTQKKSTVPRPRPTAIRSMIPRKSQDENCFVKPVRRPRPRALSGKKNLDSPTARDFFKKVPVSWNQPPRDKDTRQPNLSNITLMSISTAAQQTGIRSNRRDSVSAISPTGMDRPHVQPSFAALSDDSYSSRPTVAANASTGHVRPNGQNSGNQMDTLMDTAPPFAQSIATGQQSLFVTDDDVVMEDVPELQNNSAGNTGFERRQHEQPAQYSAFQSATSPSSGHYPAFSPTRSSFISQPAQRNPVNGIDPQRAPRDRRESGPHVRSGPVTTVIDLNRVSAVPVGNLESLELRHFRGQRVDLSPTYLLLDINQNVQIQVQIKDLNTKQHHDLLQFESQSVGTRVLHYEQECRTFEEFLQLYDRKDENVFFSPGILEPNPRYPISKPQLSIIKHGTVCHGRYISLLIWRANNPAWEKVTERFIHIRAAGHCVLMFKAGVRPQIRQTVEQNSSVNRQGPGFVNHTFSDATSYLSKDSLAALQYLSGQASSLEEKRLALQQMLARPGAFSQPLSPEQKTSTFQLINRVMFSRSGDTPSIVHASGTRSPPSRTITMTSEDPRLHRKKAEQRSTILNQPVFVSKAFSFSAFRDSFMARTPHTPHSAIQIFKDTLGIDWLSMINRKESNVNVLYLYPKAFLSEELTVLKEFLHAIRARVEDADVTAQADSFWKLTKSRSEHHSGDETKPTTIPWDPDKHIRIKRGENGVVLVHPSVSPSEPLWNTLSSALNNPNVRVFRITLGQSYLDRDAIDVQPQPGVIESCKDGEHLLLTDSVILKCPKDALNMLHWLSMKQDGGRSQLWKVYARPALSSWIEELILANRANVELAGIYQQFSEMLMDLVPIEDRQYLEGDTWSSNELAVMRMDTVLPGYNYSIGTNPAISIHDIDLEHNDQQLVEWFSDTTASMHEQYRFFSVFCASSETFCKNLKARHLYLRIYPGSWGTNGYFKAENLKALWRKEGKLAGSEG